jgi:glucokinase
MILAGDVGGTKTNLGLFELAGGAPRAAAAATFANAEFPGLATLIEAFFRGLPAEIAAAGGEVSAACFGVAGPVIDNRASAPNLAWELDGAALAGELGLAAVRLINDLAATAEGLPLLAAGQLVTLQAGAAAARGGEPGNQALIAAGTGLGMALLPVSGGVRSIVPSEGGHADFAPRNEDEVALLLYLRRRFGEHVSVERVVSGRGLPSIYEHLRDAGFAPESPVVAAALAADDPAQAITAAALAGRDRLCERALDMFVAAYGAAAGNLALTATAVGGVYIGGGIAPKILPRLTGGPGGPGGHFLGAFVDKGRFAAYLRRIPVHVVLDDRAAMFGAARCAATMATMAPTPAGGGAVLPPSRRVEALSGLPARQAAEPIGR